MKKEKEIEIPLGLEVEPPKFSSKINFKFQDLKDCKIDIKLKIPKKKNA
jgi:hypothetical protein